MPAVRCPRRAGMTLIELVVVLGILAGLASMALVGAGEMGSRGRRDETVRRLDAVREAVAGDGLRPGRFISDMGRGPVAQTVEGEILKELWDDLGRTGGIDGYTDPIGKDDSDVALPVQVTKDVSLPGGWNGPYVEAPGGKFFDGWGTDFVTATIADDVVTAVASYGSDAALDDGDEEWSETDIPSRQLCSTNATLTVSLRVQGGAPGPPYSWMPPQSSGGTILTSWASSTTVSDGDVLIETSGSSSYMFRAVTSSGTGTTGAATPDWTGGDPIADNEVSWYSLSHHYVMNHVYAAVFAPYADPTDTGKAGVRIEGAKYETGDVQTVTFPNLTPGIRAVLAYGFYDDSADGNDPVNVWRSPVQTIELRPGSNFIELYLNTDEDIS